MTRTLTALALVLTLASGCSMVTGQPGPLERVLAPGVGGLLGKLADNPITKMTVADADATLAWVATQESAGSLTPLQGELARACPRAVKAAAGELQAKIAGLQAMLAAVDSSPADPAGPNLILHATQLRYGAKTDPKALAAKLRADLDLRLDLLVTGCAHLFPARQLNDVLLFIGKKMVPGL